MNKTSLFTVGAPFFKHDRLSEREPSEGSMQTKPKTGNQSNLGSEKSFTSARKNSVIEKNKPKKVISSVFFQSE